MIYTARIVFSKDYLSEMFEQSLRYGSRWLLVERLIGVIFIMAGIVMIYYTGTNTFLPVVFVLIGLFEIYSSRIRKIFWMKRSMHPALMNHEILFSFNEDGIQQENPNSRGAFSWKMVVRVVETPLGLLIWPQRGAHWYIPRPAFEGDAGEAISFIKRKAP